MQRLENVIKGMKTEEEISPSHVLCYGEDGGSVIRIKLISLKRGSSYNSEWPVSAVSEKTSLNPNCRNK